MIRIFLSYAREDYAAVKKLYERLKVAGYQPWMDKVDLLKGDDFTKAIPKVIRETDFFIVCMSTRSVVKRSFVQREIKLALDLFQDKLASDLFIFPVRLEECETPDHISNFNWTDLFGAEADDEWEALLRSLHEGARRLGKPLITAKVVEEKIRIAPRFESYTEDLGNGVKLEMVAIPGGTFMMGASEAEKVYDDEMPQHQVTLSEFYLGKYQVTQAQWEAVMGNNPSYFKGANLPVERVSWEDAQEFCQKLSQRTKKTYRLPTEAEWEYACRAGTTGAYAGVLDEMAWYNKNSEGKTHAVGQKKPNVFGLYDMHGNVWEWCQDWYGNYSSASQTNPTGPQAGTSRVLRGGSWFNLLVNARAVFRVSLHPSNRDYDFGFRVVCVGRPPL